MSKGYLIIPLMIGCVLAQDDVERNICLLSHDQISDFLKCGLECAEDMPELMEVTKAQLTAFPNLDYAEIIQLVCKATNDEGEAALDEFVSTMEEEHQDSLNNVFNNCMIKIMNGA